jgi:hypothetical protein
MTSPEYTTPIRFFRHGHSDNYATIERGKQSGFLGKMTVLSHFTGAGALFSFATTKEDFGAFSEAFWLLLRYIRGKQCATKGCRELKSTNSVRKGRTSGRPAAKPELQENP